MLTAVAVVLLSVALSLAIYRAALNPWMNLMLIFQVRNGQKVEATVLGFQSAVNGGRYGDLSLLVGLPDGRQVMCGNNYHSALPNGGLALPLVGSVVHVAVKGDHARLLKCKYL